jgi:hypothetical protein
MGFGTFSRHSSEDFMIRQPIFIWSHRVQLLFAAHGFPSFWMGDFRGFRKTSSAIKFVHVNEWHSRYSSKIVVSLLKSWQYVLLYHGKICLQDISL